MMDFGDLQTLTVAIPVPGVALVTMDRPDKLNAMNRQFFAELPALLRRLDDSREVVACVLTGAGRAFSAGGDIADFDALRVTADYRSQVRAALECFDAVERSEVVVIAAVNGLAFGGGTELTLACDMALAAETARFAFKEVSLGLTPAYGALRGPDAIGRPWTRWLALTGDEIDAAQALSIGLVQQIVAPEDLVDAAISVAGRIAAHPPLGVRAGKRLINRTTGPDGLGGAIETAALLHSSDDHRERISEFMAGRDRPGR